MPQVPAFSNIAALSGLFLAVALAVTVPVPVPAAAGEEAQVTIDNFTFSPASVTVAAGTRVTWTNRDDIPHTVTGSDEPRVMKSPPLDTGDTFAMTFDHPGTYRYFCSLHPHMQGVVVVR
ncbi:Amicyanin [Rhodovastum atsumiense]|uniref:Amicyanin n=1 Tax=Rhodovastum atsumiense TaxID=504468 RepID=A0A5M6IJW9_9PROT|nr:cupredoxin family copper-binding protein [Rhodovastum atsumiense]KAA5608187.1 amicyanin [Rhodovastum atsumiense]CAH2602554.1 Amicyanin [Rhodovastum atsumiense]